MMRIQRIGAKVDPPWRSRHGFQSVAQPDSAGRGRRRQSDILKRAILLGIFIDDRRDPKERVSIVADHGTVVKSGNGSFRLVGGEQPA
jgi:hypothetical protein